jgi:hypothetical protein
MQVSRADELAIEPRTRTYDAKTRLDAVAAKLAGEDSMNLDSFNQDEVESMLGQLKKVPGFEWIDPKNPDHLYLAVDQGAQNLYNIANSASPEEVARWRRWYEAASTFAKDVGDEHGFSHETTTAVIAVLSPTKDWNGNVAMADHVSKLVKDKDFQINEELADLVVAVMTAEHFKQRSPGGALTNKIETQRNKIASTQAEIVALRSQGAKQSQIDTKLKIIRTAEQKIAELEEEFRSPPIRPKELIGKQIKDFDFKTQARIVKLHAQNFGAPYMGQPPVPKKNNGLRNYNMDVAADGSFDLSPSTNKTGVQSYVQYEKALRILAADKDGKPNFEVISRELGKGSKVRSFYSNILSPNDTEYWEITADTHHFGAATLIPVSASHEILDSIFLASGDSGASAAYPIFRAMTILATSRWNSEKGDDLLPRAMQSVAWERARQLVPTTFPNPKKPSQTTKDSSLKGHMADTFAQIARLTSGPNPKRKDLVGRQLAMLEELSLRLQAVPKNERAEVLQKWRKEYKLARIPESELLKREIKKDSKGQIYVVDRESKERQYIDVDGLTDEERKELGLDSPAPKDIEPQGPTGEPTLASGYVDRTPNQEILKKNDDIKKALAAQGASPFNPVSSISPTGASLLSAQERVNARIGYINNMFDSVRTAIEQLRNNPDLANGNNQDYWQAKVANLRPDLIEFLETHSNEELLNIMREQSVKFNQTASRSVRVNMPIARLDGFIADGKYLTTHSARSNHSGPAARVVYEETFGIPRENIDPELRPASGYLVHPDWEEAALEEARRRVDLPENRKDTLTDFSQHVTESGANGPVDIYGKVILKLRPEVSERTGYGRGDSLNNQSLPSSMDETDPDKIMTALVPSTLNTMDNPFNQSMNLIDSHLAGSFKNFNNGSHVTNSARSEREYIETLILGSFSADEVEEITLPWENLKMLDRETERYQDEVKLELLVTMRSTFLKEDVLRMAGFTEEEINYVMSLADKAEDDARQDRRNFLPGLINSKEINDFIRTREAMRRKDLIEELGINVKAVSPDGKNYLDPATYGVSTQAEVDELLQRQALNSMKEQARRDLNRRSIPRGPTIG